MNRNILHKANCTFFLVFSFSLFSYSQKYDIKGKVILSDAESMGKAVVQLFHKDFDYIDGVAVDSAGVFNFIGKTENEREYALVTSHLGYYTDTMYVQPVKQNIDVGSIFLRQENVLLNEVYVSAQSIVNSYGIKLVYPTHEQREKSIDGITLISKINLPRLNVDEISKKIQLNGGGKVVVCKNGKITTLYEISAIKPENIIRIEYHDIPEAKYNYADVVLDYIVRQNTSGGNIYLSLWQSKGFGEDFISTRFNYGKSEFSFDYYLAYRDWEKLYRYNSESFRLTGRTLERYEDGEPDLFKYDNHTFNLRYNYQHKNRILNITSKLSLNRMPHRDWKSNISLYEDQNATQIDMLDKSNTRSNIPEISVYFQQPVKENSTLIVKTKGVKAKNKYTRMYSEKNNTDDSYELTSAVDGDQSVFDIWGIFEHKLTKSTISTGANYLYNDSENNYDNSTNSSSVRYTSNLNIQHVYLFSQFDSRINDKINYRLGIGVNRTWLTSGDKKNNTTTLQPSASLRYTPNKTIEVAYYGSIYNKQPSLADLSDFDQPIDSIQINRGNPDLKRQISYYNAIQLNFNLGKFGSSLYLNNTYTSHPIMESTYLEDGKVIRVMENHKNFKAYNAEIELRANLVNDHIRMKTYAGTKYFVSNGLTYKHNKQIFYYGGRISAHYGFWAASWQFNQNTSNTFWGETLTKFEDAHMVSLSYSRKSYRISADALNLFSTKHINAKENYSAVASFSRYEYLDEIRNLFRLNFTLNLDFGRKYNAQRRRNYDNTISTTILKGEK